MRTALLAALALLLGCGPSRERERFEAFRDYCLGLVASGATGLDAARRFGEPASLFDCALAPQQPLPSGVDQCDYQAGWVCQAFWVSYASDDSLCGPPGLGGCWFWCEVRVPGDVQPVPADTVVCGSRFVSGQPCPPYQC